MLKPNVGRALSAAGAILLSELPPGPSGGAQSRRSSTRGASPGGAAVRVPNQRRAEELSCRAR